MSSESNKFDVPEIDFLPAGIREEGAKRKTHVWRIVVVAAVAALLPAASFYQHRIRASLQGELQVIEPEHTKAQANQVRLAELKKELLSAEAGARLVTFLKHPWPRTQILDAIVTNLPESISLDELTIERGTKRAAPERRRKARPNPESSRNADSGAAADFATLRTEADGSHVTVILSGSTTDVGELHTFLGKLAEHRLFERAELESIESAARGNSKAKSAGGSQFRSRVIVRPGYGLSRGPRQAQSSTGETHRTTDDTRPRSARSI